MSRPSGWSVRVSPDVDDAILAVARRDSSARLVTDVLAGFDRLARSGTRATGVKKLRSLDLWEIRLGDYRAYFCPVPGTDLLAVGVLEAKRTRRLRMERIKTIERKVHGWRDSLAAQP